MVFVSQQYDTYQSTVKVMNQKDTDRNAENLQVIYPGIGWPPAQTGVSCSGGSCDQFVMTLMNLAGIGTQIARIYINSTAECKNLCVLDPAPKAANSAFNMSSSFINPSEGNHTVIFWFTTGFFLNQTAPGVSNEHTVSIVTTRGRIF